MSTRTRREGTIRAVQCHRFACVEQETTNNNTDRLESTNARATFRPRSPKALRLKDCLSLDRIPVPVPDEREIANRTNDNDNDTETRVWIRTEYAGVQYPDALQALGLYQIKPQLPYVPGMDVVGIVWKVIPPAAAAAAAATNRSNNTQTTPQHSDASIRPGDRVLATLLDRGGTGGLSEVVSAPLKHVHKLPKMLPGRSAAVFANVGRNYFAAYHALVEVGGIRPNRPRNDEIVLVTGASGGVGMATIELAKAMGCMVIAGVGSPSKREGPTAAGADAVFCYGRSKAERKRFRKQVLAETKARAGGQSSASASPSTVGVDLVVDVVMGDLFEEALVGCVKPLGTIALVGFAAGQRPIRPGILLLKEVRVAGSIWGRDAMEATEERSINSGNNKYRIMAETILGYFASGAIRGRVDRIVPLSNFIEAFEVFEENKGRGNTVVSFVDHHGDHGAGTTDTRSRL